jgi:predicted nucleic acid-binding protein
MKAAAIKRFVLDASVTVAWCFEDETTKFSEAVLDLFSDGAEAVVPSIWPLEVANALLTAERRKRIAPAQVSSFLQWIGGLPISVIAMDAEQAFRQVLPQARQYGLSEYDAAYLNLSLVEELPLATVDSELRRSARTAGVTLISG